MTGLEGRSFEEKMAEERIRADWGLIDIDKGRERAVEDVVSIDEEDGIVGRGGREKRVGEPVRVGEAGTGGRVGEVMREGESLIGDGGRLLLISPKEVVRMTGLSRPFSRFENAALAASKLAEPAPVLCPLLHGPGRL